MYNPLTGYPITDDWDDHIRRGSAGGIDYKMPVGTPLPSPEAGTVSYIPNNGTGGHTAVITHKDGRQTVYMHLSSFTLWNGALVNAGDIVGKSGGAKGAPGAGSSTGPHLHAHQNQNGRRVPPFDGMTSSAMTREEDDMNRILIVADARNGRIVTGQRFYQGADQVMYPLTKRQYEIDNRCHPNAIWTEWTGDDAVAHAKNVGLYKYTPDPSVKGGVGKLTGPIIYDL